MARTSPEVREFTVSAEESGTRVDFFLTRRLPEWSRSQLQRLIRAGLVTIGARAARKAGEEVKAGDHISVRLEPREVGAAPECLPLAIVYEDADLVVVNKPAGMVVHVGAGVKSGTLVNALLHHIAKPLHRRGRVSPGHCSSSG